jgi:NAD(P)-dependent dehydrogenase (short-subunit alcohol dehydrogenase family)
LPTDGASRNDGVKFVRQSDDASRRRADRALTVPFGRQGTGWKVDYAALFLISSESSSVNAHTLFLDGGHPAGIARG